MLHGRRTVCPCLCVCVCVASSGVAVLSYVSGVCFSLFVLLSLCVCVCVSACLCLSLHDFFLFLCTSFPWKRSDGVVAGHTMASCTSHHWLWYNHPHVFVAAHAWWHMCGGRCMHIVVFPGSWWWWWCTERQGRAWSTLLVKHGWSNMVIVPVLWWFFTLYTVTMLHF